MRRSFLRISADAAEAGAGCPGRADFAAPLRVPEGKILIPFRNPRLKMSDGLP
jgi:hypothetical protein